MRNGVSDLDQTYKSCNKEGLIKPKEKVDIEIIKSLFESSREGFERLKVYNYKFEKKTNNYAFVFRDYYEVLRMLTDAFLYFDKIKINNHQCSNSYLCKKHPELEFDWETLETMRILRNAINYEGKKINKELWSKIRFRFDVYIRSLNGIIKKKIEKLK